MVNRQLRSATLRNGFLGLGDLSGDIRSAGEFWPSGSDLTFKGTFSGPLSDAASARSFAHDVSSHSGPRRVARSVPVGTRIGLHFSRSPVGMAQAHPEMSET